MFHSSVAVVAGGTSPPNANAAVVEPVPPNCPLAIFKSLTSTQLVPFHSSVFPVKVGVPPPKPKAAVEVPPDPKPFLPVFKSFTSVQADPF